MATRKYCHVFVRTKFIGFHRWKEAPDGWWKEAPDGYAFLKDWHRHEFHVELCVEVIGLNREVEFLQLKDRLEIYLAKYRNAYFEQSCEQIADDIVQEFKGLSCEVSEDGENGSRVSYVTTPW